MASGYVDLPILGVQSWKAPVANAAALPATGNTAGDARVTIDNSVVNVWDGAAWVAPSGSGTVTSVAMTVPGFLSVAGSPVTSAGTLAVTLSGTALPVANGGTGLTSGTSGGVLAYTASGVLASSGALTANRIVLGGGAGVAPTVLGSLGTTTTVLHGNAAGAPTFGAISLTADVSGIVPVANGGTNSNAALSNNRFIVSTGSAIVEASAVTASRGLVSDSNGLPTAATTTATEIGYVNGVTSAIQTQLNLKAPAASPAFTTQVTFGNYHMEPAEANAGNSSTAVTIDWATAAAQRVTMTGSCTFTFSNPVTGGTYVLRVLTGAGSFTATWPATVKWSGAVTPTITATASRMDLISFYYDGSVYYGTIIQNFTP